MRKQMLVLTTCAFFLAFGAAVAGAEEGPGHEGHGMMGQGSMMGCGMMGRGGMTGGGGMMGQGAAMRFIFALIDSDGDGTVSLQEFQAAHEKSLRRWMSTKMAPSLSRRCKHSCEELVNRLRRNMDTIRYSTRIDRWSLAVRHDSALLSVIEHAARLFPSWGGPDKISDV